MTGVYRFKKASFHLSAAKKKRAFRPAYKPLISWWSTADFVSLSVETGFRLFVLVERRWHDGFSML